MNEKGWGWSPSEIRQTQLIEWLAQQPAGNDVTAAPFYDALEDQGMNNPRVMLHDLEVLEAQSLIYRYPGLAGIPDQRLRLNQELHDRAGELRSRRADKGLRRRQCRNAMVDWLHSIDAVREGPDMPATEAMRDDVRHGFWFGEQFTAQDLDDAAARLYEQGLVGGSFVDQARGPVRLHLTDAGVTCAEEFGSDTSRHDKAQRMPGSGPTVNLYGGNSGPFQVAGDNAHQEQHIDVSADQLRTMINDLAKVVADLVPAAAGSVAGQQETALAAAQDQAVNISVLHRFRDWVVTTVTTGASQALAQMVTSGADDMMREALRLAGHL